MGFSVTISGTIVLAVLFLSVAMMISAVLKVYEATMTSLERRTDAISKENFSLMFIRSATVNSSLALLTFEFSNNGSTVFWDFNSFDLIIYYNSNLTGSTKSVRLVYPYSWNISYIMINGGYALPFSGKVEPSESALVQAQLPLDVNYSSPIKILFVNQYGFKAYYELIAG